MPSLAGRELRINDVLKKRAWQASKKRPPSSGKLANFSTDIYRYHEAIRGHLALGLASNCRMQVEAGPLLGASMLLASVFKRLTSHL